jgi:hypothetical protein
MDIFAGDYEYRIFKSTCMEFEIEASIKWKNFSERLSVYFVTSTGN